MLHYDVAGFCYFTRLLYTALVINSAFLAGNRADYPHRPQTLRLLLALNITGDALTVSASLTTIAPAPGLINRRNA